MEQIHIAIVEDQKEYSDALLGHIARYEKENAADYSFKCEVFSNAINFLEGYKADYQIVFMDISMPYMNGLDAAHQLRNIDPNVILIFATNFAQYAINGYEVNAFDYCVKPINYYDFALKFTRALKQLHLDSKGKTLTILTDDGYVKVPELDIVYVETDGHHVVYHLKDSEFRQYASLRKAAQQLSKEYFVKCNSCYLINLLFVNGVKDYIINVGGENLEISHPRRKEILQRIKDLK